MITWVRTTTTPVTLATNELRSHTKLGERHVFNSATENAKLLVLKLNSSQNLSSLTHVGAFQKLKENVRDIRVIDVPNPECRKMGGAPVFLEESIREEFWGRFLLILFFILNCSNILCW